MNATVFLSLEISFRLLISDRRQTDDQECLIGNKYPRGVNIDKLMLYYPSTYAQKDSAYLFYIYVVLGSLHAVTPGL